MAQRRLYAIMCFFTILFWVAMVLLRLWQGGILDIQFWALSFFGWLVLMMFISPTKEWKA